MINLPVIAAAVGVVIKAAAMKLLEVAVVAAYVTTRIVVLHVFVGIRIMNSPVIAAVVEVLEEVVTAEAYEVALIVGVMFDTELLLLCNLGHLSQSRVNQTWSAREVNQF